MPNVRENANPTKSTGSLPPVTPIEVDRARRSVLDVVRNNIPKVREVLKGNKNWSNQQVRLFSVMLNKVLPDLHHSFNEHSVEHKNVDQLSIQELEEIARKADEGGEDVIEHIEDSNKQGEDSGKKES